MRDREGLLQVVIDPDTPEAFATADAARSEYLLKITGRVRRRYEGTENPNMVSGQVELLGKEIELLAKSDTPPFPLNDDNITVSEELRLKYRFGYASPRNAGADEISCQSNLNHSPLFGRPWLFGC